MQPGLELHVAALTATAALDCGVDDLGTPDVTADLALDQDLRRMFSVLAAQPVPEHLSSLADILEISGLVPSLQA